MLLRDWRIQAAGAVERARRCPVVEHDYVAQRVSANRHIHPVQLHDGRFVLPCVSTPHPNACGLRAAARGGALGNRSKWWQASVAVWTCERVSRRAASLAKKSAVSKSTAETSDGCNAFTWLHEWPPSLSRSRVRSLHDLPPPSRSLKCTILATAALCVLAWCAVLSTVAMCIVAGMVAWAADSLHIIKHIGETPPFVQYTNKDNWLGWPEADVDALYREIRNNFGQFTVST